MITCFLAEKGFKVDLFEMRSDIRLMEHVQGKSINLAISERGRSALRALGLEDEVLNRHAIPMRARLIHDLNGRRRAIPYGTSSEQAIYSVSRRFINELLLSKAECNQNVRIYFNHKLLNIDLAEGKSYFAYSFNQTKTQSSNPVAESQSNNVSRSSTPLFGSNGDWVNQQQTNGHQNGQNGVNGTNHQVELSNRKSVETKMVIGADGAFSAVRRVIMKYQRMNFSQEFIDHGYIELNIPMTADGDFAMEINYLHIWPRGTFMMIALPNQDKSFTVTLFMPFEYFESIKNSDQLMDFFNQNFPDSIPLIGRDNLIKDFFGTKPSPLVSIKCRPLNYKDKALIIGDAAHAMVPFFGQGMNCGFEDCLILSELLEKHGSDMKQVLNQFTKTRNDDHHVICDLAMINYVEMRHLVNSKAFLLRKKIDLIMNRLLPDHWIPLYSMVTFTRIPYSAIVDKRQIQDQLIKNTVYGIGLAAILMTGFKYLRIGLRQ